MSICDNLSHERYAKILYNAYGDESGWKNYNGGRMPTWEELPKEPDIRGRWNAAAKALVGELEQDDLMIDNLMIKIGNWEYAS